MIEIWGRGIQFINAHLKRMRTKCFWQIAGLVLSIAAAAFPCMGQVATTLVQDTVYHADGTVATGTILVTWPAFVTAGGNTVAAGNLTEKIGANGQVTLNLAPNVGATPSGTYYTAVYHLDDGTVSKEYWSVPSVPSTTVAAIRSLVMPASVAVQTLSATEVNSMLGNYLPISGGTLNGPLQLQSDPKTAMQAATKDYVDNAVGPVAAGLSQTVSSTPTASQVVDQPAGTNLAANIFQGSYYASQYQTGSLNNGIANLTKSANCATSSPSGLSGCTVFADPTYPNTEHPQGYGAYLFGDNTNNMTWPLDTHVHDERNGVTADYYENPFSLNPPQSAGQTITTGYTLDFQQWPAYNGNSAGTEYLQTTDYAGGYNFDNYFASGQPEYLFKTYYSNLMLASTNYTSGQLESMYNWVNCHGVGDCLGMSTLIRCDGGMNSSNDEGCHGGDFTVSEDPAIYKGTMTAAAAVGATLVKTNGTSGQGTEGQDRTLVDTNPADIITGASFTGWAGSVQTGPSGNSAVNPLVAIDSGANYPVSTMIQLCYPGSDNGASGAAGCTAGSQPIGFIPSAPNMINPAASITTDVVASYTATAPDTGLPAGFCTPSTLQSSNSGAACYLPPSGTACITDQEEYETVDYTYDSTAQTVTLLNLRFPHTNGVFFAHGGLCGYAVENQANVFSGDGKTNGISQIFPIEGSPNSTSFYYISQRTNLGYTAPVLGPSVNINETGVSGGSECFSLPITNTQLQADNHTVLVTAWPIPFNSGANLSPVNGMTLTFATPNASYNGNYVATWGVTNGNADQFTYYLPTTPTGTVPTSGTASFCNTNYKLYPAVRVNSVLDTATNKVDGTMTTMPMPIAFASGDTVMEAHYPWIYTGHDMGRGVDQFLPRVYNGGALYGMTYGYLLSGTPFVGFQINNGTDQDRYLGYGGTHEPPGYGFDLGGYWNDSFVTNSAPEEAVLEVANCKPGPVGCNSYKSFYDDILDAGTNQALVYDPRIKTWTFGPTGYTPTNNPPIGSGGGIVQANTFKAFVGVGVGGSYLFNASGAIGVTTTPNNPSFSMWFANYAYGFGAQNTTVIDGYLYRGASADSIDCGKGTGDTSCTFTVGTLNAGSTVNSPSVVASTSITTPSLNVGGGTSVSHIGYYTTGAVTPVAVPAQSCTDQAFPVSGLVVADNLGSIQPPAALGNLSVDGYSSAANTVLLHFCNVSTTSVVPPAGAYTFLAMH